MKFKENLTEYLMKNAHNHEKLEEFSDFIQNFFIGVEEENAHIAYAFHDELDDFIYEVDEEIAIVVIESFKKRDGSHSGMKWTKSEVDSLAKQNDIAHKIEATGKKYDCLKFWIAMNYVYAVHFNINRTTNGYIELAIDEITNRNICFEELVKKISKRK